MAVDIVPVSCTKAISTPSRSSSAAFRLVSGALLYVMIFKVDLSIYVFVGLIHAHRPGQKNAIMTDSTTPSPSKAEMDEGKSPKGAIYDVNLT